MADESFAVYQRLFQKATTLKQKYSIMMSLTEMNDPQTASVMADAVRSAMLVDRARLSAQDRDYFDKVLRLSIAGLGTYKALDMQDQLMTIAVSDGDVLVRAEALIALGRMRALKHVERMSLLLKDLNLGAGDDKDGMEKLAGGAIVGLGKMGDIRGWEQVFFASQGWYSRRVKQSAEESLLSMVDDPTEAVKKIIDAEPPPLKLAALDYETASKAPAAKKSEVAVLAFKEGAGNAGQTAQDKTAYKYLRQTAMEQLIANGYKDGAIVEDFHAAWAVADQDERLLIMAALGANGSDRAADELSAIITAYNLQREQDAVKEETDRMAKAALQNAAKTGNQRVLAAVVSVTMNDKWSGGVLLAANEAQKALKGK
jgi:hypothetical protein